MSGQKNIASVPADYPGHRKKLHDVRDASGSLLARLDEQGARELGQRGLIRVNEKCKAYTHFVAVDPGAVALWARSRIGGSHTTVERDMRTVHRALRPLLGVRA